MTLAALCCPHCGAPVGLRSTFCPHCRAPIHVRELLKLDAPPAPHVTDFRTGATPTGLDPRAFVGTAGVGLRTTASAGVISVYSEGAPTQNGAAALTAIVHDPDGGLEVGVRITHIRGARVGYVLRVRPVLGEWWLSRVIATETKPLARDVLRSGRTKPVPSNDVITIELRAADELLEAHVGNERVGRAEDPFFGFGRGQWGVVSYGQHARITLLEFSTGRL